MSSLFYRDQYYYLDSIKIYTIEFSLDCSTIWYVTLELENSSNFIFAISCIDGEQRRESWSSW
jgi:hypothetical protein